MARTSASILSQPWTKVASVVGAVVIILLGMNVFNSSRSTGPGGATRPTDTHNVSQVWVPPGCFLMGTDPKVDHPAQEVDTHVNEFPQHRVCITKGFWLDEYEVTNASYRDFIGDGGYIKQQYWSPAGWKWKTDNSVQPD